MVKRYFIPVTYIVSLFFSCKKNNSNSDNDRYINKWIYNEMSLYYLWNTKILHQPNYGLSPENFFESSLYNKGQVTGDHFSWIQENYVDLLNSIQGVTPYDIGFEYIVYQLQYSTDLIGQTVYIKPNTNTERLGLKRGDFFMKVNGIALDATNWRNLLSGKKTSATISFIDMGTGIITNKTVQKTANYAEDSVFFDDIYKIEGHKIGYLVYNFFASSPTYENNSYDKKLNEIFGRFKNADKNIRNVTRRQYESH